MPAGNRAQKLAAAVKPIDGQQIIAAQEAAHSGIGADAHHGVLGQHQRSIEPCPARSDEWNRHRGPAAQAPAAETAPCPGAPSARGCGTCTIACSGPVPCSILISTASPRGTQDWQPAMRAPLER